MIWMNKQKPHKMYEGDTLYLLLSNEHGLVLTMSPEPDIIVLDNFSKKRQNSPTQSLEIIKKPKKK